jgi:hypothetical protein
MLVQEAIDRGTRDNVTAIVVFFNWEGKEVSIAVPQQNTLSNEEKKVSIVDDADSSSSTQPTQPKSSTSTQNQTSPPSNGNTIIRVTLADYIFSIIHQIKSLIIHTLSNFE